MINAFTVDVEEWFHICGVAELSDPRRWDALPSRIVDNTSRVLDLLDRVERRGTFFVVGWIADRHPALVARIRDAGHEIGCHSHFHRRVYELEEGEFARDLAAARAALAAAGAPAVTMYRAPEWSINDRAPWALARLVAEGFSVDSSRAPMRLVGNPAYPQTPHLLDTACGPIVEVPPAVTSRFGQQVPFGGGWGLRMTRPARLLRELARRNAAGRPATLWIHPWELDPAPPRVRLPAGKAFAHYFRLSGLAGRLNVVLREAPFGTLSDMLASIPGMAMPVPVLRS